MSTRKDLTGKIYGILTVIGYSHSDKSWSSYWWCRCKCGRRVRIQGKRLNNGEKTSCGCERKPKPRRVFTAEMDEMIIKYYPQYGSRKVQSVLNTLYDKSITTAQINDRAKNLKIKLNTVGRPDRSKQQDTEIMPDPLLLSSITLNAFLCSPWGRRITANPLQFLEPRMRM